MNKDLQSSVVDLIKKIDGLKSEIDKFHPLPKEVEDRILQKYRLDWNYNSNAIEGNTLNYGETYAFLMHGITAHGKPLKDYLDIRGHNEAINFLVNFVRNKEELTEAVIRELHKVILVESYETDAVTQNGKFTKKTVTLGAYKTQPNHVKTATGEIHYFASPEETPAKMHELMNWYRDSKEKKETHPVVLAAIFHHRFSEIHPFDDGNGRLARLLMNLIFMQNNFPPAIIKIKDKNNYYLALSQADSGDVKKFVEYVAETLINSMEVYLKGVRGESIEDPDDFEKEILLLKKEIEGRKDKFEKFNNHAVRVETLHKSIMPIISGMSDLINKIQDLFGIINRSYKLYYNNFQNHNARERLISFESSVIETDLSSLRDSDVVEFIANLNLTKFKAKYSQFTIDLDITVIFEEYDFIIVCHLSNTELPTKTIEFGLRTYEGQWIERVSYERQLNEVQIRTAKEIIGKGIVSHIKQHTNKDIND
ncbi:MAG: Fic family protein [Bacteroidetes bacterium]|nr:Fic family protein [Bacteroidota bacterium]